jgi:hypothetical protein
MQVSKVATFPNADAFCNLVIKPLCREDELISKCGFVRPVDIKDAPDYLEHFPDGKLIN